MRHVQDVIDKIKPHIPEEHTTLTQELDELRARSLFIAPEEPWVWRSLERSLVEHIGIELDEPWKVKISQIVRDEE